MRERELKHRLRLRLRTGIKAAAPAEFFKQVREVDVDVRAARHILVILTVTVVIDAFSVELIDSPLALCGISLSHQARFALNGYPCAVRHLHPHLRYDAVAVEVIVAVLISLVISIIVERPAVAGIGPERFGEVTGIGIRIAHWQYVPCQLPVQRRVGDNPRG